MRGYREDIVHHKQLNAIFNVGNTAWLSKRSCDNIENRYTRKHAIKYHVTTKYQHKME